MDNADQDAHNISSPLNVSLVDAQALESRAVVMQNHKSGGAEEEGAIPPSSQGKETNNDILTQDEAPAMQPPLHHHNESAPAQGKLEQEGLNEGENAADDAACIESMRKEVAEGEAQGQLDAGLNEGECTADDDSMKDTIQKEEAEDNGPIRIEHEPDVVYNEVKCAASDASMIPMQLEELLEGEALPRMGKQVVTSDEGGSMEKEGEGEAPNQIEEDPVVGSNVDASIDTMQNEEELAEGKAPIQVGEELEVGLNEGKFAADDVSMGTMQGEAPVQIGQKPEIEPTEGECTADEASMVTAQDEEGLRKGDTFVQIEQELPCVGSHEGEYAADVVACADKIEESDEGETPIQTEAAPDVEVSADAYGLLDVEVPIEAKKSMSDSANQIDQLALSDIESGAVVSNLSAGETEQGPVAIANEDRQSAWGKAGASTSEEGSQERLVDAAPCLAIESQDQDIGGLAVLEDEHRNQDSHACEDVEGEGNAKQDVQADSSEFPALKELNEKADHQSALTKEPSLCTPAIEALIDQHSDGDETYEGKAGNDGQSGFTNPTDGGHEMEKELSRELPDVSRQDLEIKQPTAQEGSFLKPHDEEELHIKASLAAEDEPMEDSLATVEMADEQQLEAVRLPTNEELGLDTLVTEQTREGERDVAAMSTLVEENANVDELERIADAHLNGKVESSFEFKSANRLSPTALENGDCHNIDEAKPVCECVKASDGGREVNANKTDSAQNGLFKESATADSGKHVTAEQSNGMVEVGTHLEEGTTADEREETAKAAQIVEAPMDAAVPLSSMVQENGFLHHSEDNIFGEQYTTSINAQPTEDERSREISQSLVVLQQKGKGSEGAKQKDAESTNGNVTLVRRATWWGCCDMLDVLLHKG